jgi:hypothetical protein
MINEITQWIETNVFCSGDGISWIIGNNLFPGSLPQKTASGAIVPVRCAVVLETPAAAVNWYLADQSDKAILLWNRAADYPTARKDAFCFFETMHGTAGWLLPVVGGPEYEAGSVWALAEPTVVLNPGPDGFYVFTCNYIWVMALKNP